MLSTREWMPQTQLALLGLALDPHFSWRLPLGKLCKKKLDFGPELEIAQIQILSVTVALFISTIDPRDPIEADVLSSNSMLPCRNKALVQNRIDATEIRGLGTRAESSTQVGVFQLTGDALFSADSRNNGASALDQLITISGHCQLTVTQPHSHDHDHCPLFVGLTRQASGSLESRFKYCVSSRKEVRSIRLLESAGVWGSGLLRECSR
ncbi:hypothetical protein J6590_008384 [Homalodisca vitripennis]|nr:hypothetical protein J6590_008384 [Homalodisca vitripennis]